MGQKSRRKGAVGERELARKLRDEYGYKDAKRGQQYCGLAGNADVVDALPGIHIECKRTERLSLYEAMSQAKRDAREDELPAVFHRKNNAEWVVIMTLDDWMNIYREFAAGFDLAEREQSNEPSTAQEGQ